MRSAKLPVQAIKHIRVSLPWKAAEHFANTPRFEQCCQALVAIASVVVDHREVFGALNQQALNEFIGNACGAKTTNQNGSAIGRIGQGLSHAVNELIDHGA
jgi:hypothetical protein